MANTKNAKRNVKKGIVGHGQLFVRPGKYSNALYVMGKFGRADEQRLLRMLVRRYPKLAASLAAKSAA
jgi:hypothetical protein